MKKLFTLFLILYSCMGFAQNENTGCSTEAKNRELSIANPSILLTNEQLEAYTHEYMRQHHNGARASRSGPLYVIPVVFHIIHDGGQELISDAIVNTEIAHMNEYLSASNPELSAVVPAFDTLIGDAQIEFRLAQKDPQGVCTNGIERIYTQATYIGNEYTKLHPWPNDKYLNIWVTRGIDYDITAFGVLAYALYPAVAAASPSSDGIIAKYFVLGANTAFERPSLSHEFGHWLDLLHPNSICGDTVNDHVADTPLMGFSNGCNLSQSICNPPVIENIQNIMAYSSCHCMFTKGQVDRMWATLNSSVAGRNNVVSQSNLIATGTDVSNPVSCAIPVADFTADLRYACMGQPVTFSDASYNATITSRTWAFPADATVSSFSAGTTTATFSTGGWKQVALQVSNTNGSGQKTKNLVYVSDGTQIAAPFFEGFENATTAQSQWQSINYDDNNTYFQYYQGGGHHSASSYKLNYLDTHYDGDVDELLSPAFDISGLDSTNATLSFDYSYASIDARHFNDTVSTLEVFATNDCGTTWTRVYRLSGLALFNAGVQTASYAPGQGDEYWQNVSINIPAIYRTTSVNFKIQMNNGMGVNNFYIDNINIGQSIAGIADMKTNITSMDIIPNPALGDAIVSLSSVSISKVNITLYDMQGREVSALYSGDLKVGANQIPLSAASLSDGVYIIRISNGISSMQKRLVKM